MALQTRILALINAIGSDVKSLQAQITAKGPNILVLNVGDAVPGGTPAGTIILRR